MFIPSQVFVHQDTRNLQFYSSYSFVDDFVIDMYGEVRGLFVSLEYHEIGFLYVKV